MAAFDPSRHQRNNFPTGRRLCSASWMSILHPARHGSVDLSKVTLAAALNVYLPRIGEGRDRPTNANIVTFPGVGFEAPPLPC